MPLTRHFAKVQFLAVIILLNCLFSAERVLAAAGDGSLLGADGGGSLLGADADGLLLGVARDDSLLGLECGTGEALDGPVIWPGCERPEGGVEASSGGDPESYWSDTTIQFLYGEGFKLGSGGASTDKAIFTLEHFSTWKYGDNYFFVDLISETNGTKETFGYGEYYSRLSLSKLGRRDLSRGIFQDAYLGAGFNLGSGAQVGTYGLSTNWNVPHFTFFQVDFYAYDEMRRGLDLTYVITPIWSVTVDYGRTKWVCRGFVDFIGSMGQGTKPQVYAEPQFLLDVGHLAWDRPNKLYTGIEYHYWRNKFGIDGIDESVVLWTLHWHL